ncbi:MAG: hypothetical protein HYZ28_27300 [Myxococcales bacterium]|nr:hypothetical protein [Myxococcales bacterium]
MLPVGALVWNDNLVNRLQLVLALAGLGVLAWGYWLAHKGRPEAYRQLRDTALLALGILGALAYCNFGKLHFGNFIHTWDTFHYYIGSKYFSELGYDRLYECTAVADAEASYEPVKQRVYTELRTNEMVKADEILAHPERCKQHFGEARWAEFVQDISWFRRRVNKDRWEQIQHDHGYNATPVWNMLGQLLSNTGPASGVQVPLLGLLDPLCYLALAALIFWAFGWRVLAVALLALGTNFANRYYWTGGAFLRHDWLFFLGAYVCLLKKERYFLAGLAIAYSTLLRLFPGFALVGPLLAAADILWRERRLDRRYLKLFAGAALGVALLVPASLWASGGVDAYRRFAQNTHKHATTPLTNHMGLRTAVSYRPSTIGAHLRQSQATDPWAVWKQARLRTFGEAKPLFYLLALAFTALLYLAVRGVGHEPWTAAALSVAMIAVGAELTCYYYCFVMVVAVLFLLRREVGLLLLTLTAVTQFIGWAPLPNMSRWEDEQYTAMSFASLIALGGVLWVFTPHGAKGCLPPDVPPEPPPIPRAEHAKRERRRKKNR